MKIFENSTPFQFLPESDSDLKVYLNYNPQHNEYTRRQNIPERSPDETDRGGWRGYDRVYTKYLSEVKININDLLEIGIYYGYGLLAWARYFKNSRIYGVDIAMSGSQLMEIDTIRHSFPDFNRVNISLSDSTDENMWPFKENQFDIIIDDGDHHPQSQIKTLECGWKYLKNKGYYFIEDVSHRYGEEYISLLHDKLIELSGENYVSVYSHDNAGLKYINNKQMMKENRIVTLSKSTEYIVVIQKS